MSNTRTFTVLFDGTSYEVSRDGKYTRIRHIGRDREYLTKPEFDRPGFYDAVFRHPEWPEEPT